MSDHICNACGQRLGTGTLADAVPYPSDPTMPTAVWRRFARRYRCPVCAEEERSDAPRD